MDSEKQRQWMVVAVLAVVVVGATIISLLVERPARVTDFEECRSAGGVLMESYPEQCQYDGETFVDESQDLFPKGPIADEIDLIGLTESDALAVADDNDIPARVVERDGESIPITMDFVYGRHNLYVRDGNVYEVEIEG